MIFKTIYKRSINDLRRCKSLFNGVRYILYEIGPKSEALIERERKHFVWLELSHLKLTRIRFDKADYDVIKATRWRPGRDTKLTQKNTSSV